MNIEKITKIAKKIFAAIILKDENAFKKYLEDHPNYREGTVFIVDGAERKAPPKKKKSSPRNGDELKTINGVFNGAFRALEGKGYKINELTPEQTEKFHNMLNGILEKNKIRPLSKEEFKEMFTSEINKRFPKKEDKKEVPPKKENPKQEERNKLIEMFINNYFDCFFASFRFKKQYDELLEKQLNIKKRGEDIRMPVIVVNENTKVNERGFVTGQLGIEKVIEQIKKLSLTSLNYLIDRNGWNKFKVEIMNATFPDIDRFLKSLNNSLASKGFSTATLDEVKEKYNDIMFPFVDVKSKKNDLEEFCNNYLCEDSEIPENNTELSAHIINATQRIKREFPEICKLKLKRFSCCDNLENLSGACGSFYADRSRGEAGIGYQIVFNDEFLTNLEAEIQYNFKNKEYELGCCFYGAKNKKDITHEKMVESTAYHEAAHMIKRFYFEYNGGIDLDNKPLLIGCQKIDRKISNLYKKSLKNGDIFKLSEYASTEPEEFWAEIFSIYYTDKSILPPNILIELEEIINALKSQIIKRD